MNSTSQICDPILLNRFIDGDLDSDESTRINNHILQCNDCRSFIVESRQLSTLINDNIREALDQQSLDYLDRKLLNLIEQKKTNPSHKFIDLFLKKWLFVPAMALASVILFLSVVSSPETESGPSAIVASIEGDVSSIVIMETPNTHQTIIWFKETL